MRLLRLLTLMFRARPALQVAPAPRLPRSKTVVPADEGAPIRVGYGISDWKRAQVLEEDLMDALERVSINEEQFTRLLEGSPPTNMSEIEASRDACRRLLREFSFHDQVGADDERRCRCSKCIRSPARTS